MIESAGKRAKRIHKAFDEYDGPDGPMSIVMRRIMHDEFKRVIMRELGGLGPLTRQRIADVIDEFDWEFPGE